MINQHQINSKLIWYEVVSPDQNEINQLIDLGIDNDLLTYALDRNESARTQIDETDNTLLTIFDVLTPDPDVPAATEPVGLIINQKNDFFTIARQSTNQIADKVLKDPRQLLPEKSKIKAVDLLINVTYQSSIQYIQTINEINRQRNLVEEKLKHGTSRTEINQLMALETTAIYLKDSLRTNGTAMKNLHNNIKNLSKNRVYHLELAETENNQALEMINLTTDIISSISKAYSALSDSALNKTLNLLTIWTIFLAVPAAVTGFYGMNVKLPFEDNPLGWVIALLITFILCFLIYLYLKKLHIFDN